MKKTVSIIATFLALPLIALAQTSSGGAPNFSYFQTVVSNVGHLLNSLIPILIALTVLAFFWGLIQYVWQGEEGKEKGKSTMMAGLISLFVMLSLWGIINFLQFSLGINSNGNSQQTTFTPPSVPQLQ